MSHLDSAEAILDSTGEGYANDLCVVESAIRELIAHLREGQSAAAKPEEPDEATIREGYWHI